MENVFKYLVKEIKSNIYLSTFKKKMLDLILCLSYENANIRDYALHDLLSLVKNLDVNINQKTTLLILMNFSSISSNFTYLMQNDDENNNENNNNNFIGNKKKNINKNKDSNNNDQNSNIMIKKKDFINVVNHLIDADRFSQILIQRLLINITSIEGIDMSIISDKIMKVLIEILQKCKTLQENIIIFSLATLVNVSNRNILKFNQEEENENNNNNNNLNSQRNNSRNKIRNLFFNSSHSNKHKKSEIKNFKNIFINSCAMTNRDFYNNFNISINNNTINNGSKEKIFKSKNKFNSSNKNFKTNEKIFKSNSNNNSNKKNKEKNCKKIISIQNFNISNIN
jgi:hypothetical protein